MPKPCVTCRHRGQLASERCRQNSQLTDNERRLPRLDRANERVEHGGSEQGTEPPGKHERTRSRPVAFGAAGQRLKYSTCVSAGSGPTWKQCSAPAECARACDSMAPAQATWWPRCAMVRSNGIIGSTCPTPGEAQNRIRIASYSIRNPSWRIKCPALAFSLFTKTANASGVWSPGSAPCEANHVSLRPSPGSRKPGG